MAATLLVIALIFAISSRGSLGIDCENLGKDSCGYAVSSKGKRCVLERRVVGCGYTCRESEIVADNLSNFIETDECINACGVNRKDLGISSDSLSDSGFIGSLCSDECYHNCSNIVDLFFNVAAGEGVYLPKFCKARKTSGRREMLELKSVYSPASAPEQAAPLAVNAATTTALAPSPS